MTTGRNDPCPCGSGKKYKQCCEAADSQRAAKARALDARVRPLLKKATEQAGLRQWLPAEQTCRQVLALVPGHPEALFLLGSMALAVTNYGAAAAYLGQAIAASPKPPVAYLSALALALIKADQLAAAEAALMRALAAAPRDAQLRVLMGMLAQLRGQWREAEQAYAEALSLQPAHAEALVYRATVLGRLGRQEEAEELLRRGLGASADVDALLVSLNNFGNSLRRMGQPKAAAVCYQFVFAVAGNEALFHRSMASLAMDIGHMEQVVAHTNRLLELVPPEPAMHSNLLLSMQYVPSVSAAELFAAQRAFAARFEDVASWLPHENASDPDKRLRVGYVSGDLCNHPVAFFMEPVLAGHDRQAVEVFCYYSHTHRDAVTERLAGHVDHWRRCAGQSDADLAAQIRRDGIDILVDLSGHTANNRLTALALKPAPVQATWIGYAGSTGLKAIDYRLTDRFMDPEEEAAPYHSEKLAFLPHSAIFRPDPQSPEVGPLPSASGAPFTFACLNTLSKINESVLAVWSRIMAQVPGSRLMIGNASNTDQREDLLARFAAAGIAEDRLLLVPRRGLVDYLRYYHEIDLALDPFPYNGGTTSFHALWMGVPVISLSGATTTSRQGAGILRGIGLDECVAADADTYVSRAVSLATDRERLATLRNSLRSRMAAWTDGSHMVPALEQVYRDMWHRWCEQPR